MSATRASRSATAPHWQKCAQRREATGSIAESISSSIDRKCEQCHKQHTLHRTERGGVSFPCLSLPSGTPRTRTDATGRGFALHGLSQQQRRHGGFRAKGANFREQPFICDRTRPNRMTFEMPRPARGYTQVLSALSRSSEFQLVLEKRAIPIVPRFQSSKTPFREQTFRPWRRTGSSITTTFTAGPPEGRFYQRIQFYGELPDVPRLALRRDNRPAVSHPPLVDVNLGADFLADAVAAQ